MVLEVIRVKRSPAVNKGGIGSLPTPSQALRQGAAGGGVSTRPRAALRIPREAWSMLSARLRAVLRRWCGRLWDQNKGVRSIEHKGNDGR